MGGSELRRRENLGYCEEQTAWFLRQIFGLVHTQDQRLSGVYFKSSVMSSAPPETLDTTVPVDATVKCVMHVKGSRSTCNSLRLMLQPSPASLCYL